MDDKSRFLNTVLAEMQSYLSPTQIDILKTVLIKELQMFFLQSQTQLMCVESQKDNFRLLKLFAAAKRLEGASEKTIQHYCYEAKKLILYFEKDFSSINTLDIQYYLSEYEKTHHVARVSLENIRRSLNGIFLWAAENKFIKENPVHSIKPIAFEKKTVEILTDDELFQIREYVRGDLRTRAIVELLISTGIRVSELLAINIEDIDFESNEILIHCAKKRRKEDRILFLTSEAKNCLKNYLEYRLTKDSRDGSALFISNRDNGARCTERLVNSSLRNIEKKIGLKKKLTVHIFRKTFASLLYRRGMPLLDVSALLGHSDTRMSETYYIGIRKEDIKRNYFKYR